MEWRLRPARDHGLTAAERLRSHHRESGLGGLMLQGLWRAGVRLHLRAFHRLQVTGRERLPATPPYVLVANHESHLDALTLASVLRGEAARRAVSLAAGDVFFGSVAAAAFATYAVNALPVWRRRTTSRDILALRQRLAEDRLVFLLFPEGTRSRDGRMAAFQPGIGALVAGTAIPVVPCRLTGCFAAWPPQSRFPLPRPLRLAIGAPLDFSALPNERGSWAKVAAACEDAVRGLGP